MTASTTDHSFRGLRVAIVHDWFQGYHGSERVVHRLLTDVFDEAAEVRVFGFHAAHELLPPELSAAITCESRLAGLPGVRQRGHDPGRWRYLLPYMPHWFRSLPLHDFDVVVSSSHAFAAQSRPPRGAAHIVYCHTPMRYAWLPETDGARLPGARGLLLRGLARWLRRVDLGAAARAGSYVAVSSAVRDRIRDFYGRDAEVIHPPVDTDDLAPADPKDGFLWVHRLVSYKRPDLVVEAFRDLPHRLTMVGVGPLERDLRASLPPNVELHGWLPRRELARLYGSSAGFIHVGEEDFGISMVEALASGTPVIALNRGGARDIVRHGVHGLLIKSPTAPALREAVQQAAGRGWDPPALAARAQLFSRDRFRLRFAEHAARLLTGGVR